MISQDGGLQEKQHGLPVHPEFQRPWRSKEEASDKAAAQGARHVNNLETVKCKNC